MFEYLNILRLLQVFIVCLYNFFLFQNHHLVQTFASHDHSSSIRCVDICGNLMASGGADDRIFIYDLKGRQEHCMLTHHNSTINCLAFTPGHSHLISGSADGCIAIVRVGNWQMEKIWEKAHKGAAILDIAIHESGKLALSLGADCTLKTWNLVKGRQAYVVNLNSKSKDAKSLTNIRWAPDGVRFVLYGGKYTEIWSIDTGGIIFSIEHESKVSSSLWLTDDKLIVGYENGQLGVVCTKDSSVEIKNAHNSRVKAVSKYENWIVTACSAGEFKIWNLHLEEIVKIDTGCRLTCLSIIPQSQIKKDVDMDKIEEISEENISNKEADINKRDNIKRGEVVIVEEEGDDSIVEMSNKPKKQKKIKSTEKSKILKQSENVEMPHKKSKKKKTLVQSVDDSTWTETVVSKKKRVKS